MDIRGGRVCGRRGSFPNPSESSLSACLFADHTHVNRLEQPWTTGFCSIGRPIDKNSHRSSRDRKETELGKRVGSNVFCFVFDRKLFSKNHARSRCSGRTCRGGSWNKPFKRFKSLTGIALNNSRKPWNFWERVEVPSVPIHQPRRYNKTERNNKAINHSLLSPPRKSRCCCKICRFLRYAERESERIDRFKFRANLVFPPRVFRFFFFFLNRLPTTIMRNYAGGCVIGSLRRREGGGFFLRSGADRVRTIRHEKAYTHAAEQGNNVGSRACWRVTIHCDPVFSPDWLFDSASESIVLSIPVQGRDIRVPIRVQPLVTHDYPRRRSSKRVSATRQAFPHFLIIVPGIDDDAFVIVALLRRRYRERLSPPFCNLL